MEATILQSTQKGKPGYYTPLRMAAKTRPGIASACPTTTPMCELYTTGSESRDDPPFPLFNDSFDSSLHEEHHRLFDAVSPSTAVCNNVAHDLVSACSFGDISPIKLNYNNTARPVQESRSSLHNGYPEYPWCPEVSNPFYVLRCSRRAFQGCRYLLPCLRAVEMCPVHVSEGGHVHHYREEAGGIPDVDVKIAVRRIETAICAFGGSLDGKHQGVPIFRNVDAYQRQLYKAHLCKRYHIGESAITWAVEENPPVNVSHERRFYPSTDVVSLTCLRHHQDQSRNQEDDGNRSLRVDETRELSIPKLKYRCKMCGQPKQNHECPYRQSLHRSIGVMVYPAINSFTAAEPGTIALPLCKMNNFVSYDSDQTNIPEYAVACPVLQSNPSAITDGRAFFNSPQSSLSNHSDGASPGLEASHPDWSQPPRSVFVDSVTLTSEQYRAVTQESTPGSYDYPAIPLTYSERKRLGDTLFELSKEIPTATGDCAALLRQARTRNEWDLAVAELLTQILVGLYCAEGDARLDGLQQYLLGLGISC